MLKPLSANLFSGDKSPFFNGGHRESKEMEIDSDNFAFC